MRKWVWLVMAVAVMSQAETLQEEIKKLQEQRQIHTQAIQNIDIAIIKRVGVLEYLGGEDEIKEGDTDKQD